MTFEAWRLIFLMATAAYLFGNLVYVAFIKAETQHWNDKTAADLQDKMFEDVCQ